MKRFVLLAALGVVGACSDSGGPAPTVAGTWHVTTGALNVGSISPATFDVVVTAVGAGSFQVSMPAITWSSGSVVFNSGAAVTVFADTAYFGFGQVPAVLTQRCQNMFVGGRKNVRRDTLTTATVTIVSGDTVPGGFCVPAATGSATATKLP